MENTAVLNENKNPIASTEIDFNSILNPYSNREQVIASLSLNPQAHLVRIEKKPVFIGKNTYHWVKVLVSESKLSLIDLNQFDKYVTENYIDNKKLEEYQTEYEKLIGNFILSILGLETLPPISDESSTAICQIKSFKIYSTDVNEDFPNAIATMEFKLNGRNYLAYWTELNEKNIGNLKVVEKSNEDSQTEVKWEPKTIDNFNILDISNIEKALKVGFIEPDDEIVALKTHFEVNEQNPEVQYFKIHINFNGILRTFRIKDVSGMSQPDSDDLISQFKDLGPRDRRVLLDLVKFLINKKGEPVLTEKEYRREIKNIIKNQFKSDINAYLEVLKALEGSIFEKPVINIDNCLLDAVMSQYDGNKSNVSVRFGNLDHCRTRDPFPVLSITGQLLVEETPILGFEIVPEEVEMRLKVFTRVIEEVGTKNWIGTVTKQSVAKMVEISDALEKLITLIRILKSPEEYIKDLQDICLIVNNHLISKGEHGVYVTEFKESKPSKITVKYNHSSLTLVFDSRINGWKIQNTLTLYGLPSSGVLKPDIAEKLPITPESRYKSLKSDLVGLIVTSKS